MSQTIDLAIEDYGQQWVEDAIMESVTNNVRKWSYVKAILSNWKANGRVAPNGKSAKNGHVRKSTDELIDEAFAAIASGQGLEGF